MSILIVCIIGIGSLFFGHYIYRKWFNPLSVYSIIWSGMIILYEIRLIPFGDLRFETWTVIIIGYFSFLLGILTVYTAKSLFREENNLNKEYEKSIPTILLDDGKILKKAIIILSVIGILSAIQHWSVLINEFGSVIGVFLNSTTYYRMRVAGEIEGVIPYIFITSYIGVFLSAIYTAYKKKLTFVAFLPIFAVVFRELANLGRAGILFGLVEFLIVFILFRYFLSRQDQEARIKKSRIIIALLVIVSISVGGAVFIKSVRNPIDTIQGTSSALKQFEGNVLISPSIYLYTCSHLGILNKYLEHDDEPSNFGGHTFLPIYNIISKTGAVEPQPFFQRGYFIPLWTNTGTYLRELDSDFGKLGILLGPFLLGLLTTYFWFRFFETGNLLSLLALAYLFLIIFFSFLVMISRLSSWFISLSALAILLPLLENYILRKFNYPNNSISS